MPSLFVPQSPRRISAHEHTHTFTLQATASIHVPTPTPTSTHFFLGRTFKLEFVPAHDISEVIFKWTLPNPNPSPKLDWTKMARISPLPRAGYLQKGSAPSFEREVGFPLANHSCRAWVCPVFFKNLLPHAGMSFGKYSLVRCRRSILPSYSQSLSPLKMTLSFPVDTTRMACFPTWAQ